MLPLKRNFENKTLFEKAEMETRQVMAIIIKVNMRVKVKRKTQSLLIHFIMAENFLFTLSVSLFIH